MRTNLATTALVRRRWACGFVLILSLFSGIAADASTYADPRDHASYCDCGPKCRRDRCCCRPSGDETNDIALSVAGETASVASTGVKSLCRMTSRCQDPVETQVRLNYRCPWCHPVTPRQPQAGCDPSATLVPLSEIRNFPLFAFRLERPPKA
ncbi:hypothetical protein GC170_00695 [bacterium]|nr:hypothetical protein [bacterium]